MDLPPMDELLDVFGQNARLSRLYTQLCLCFPLSDKISNHRHKVITLLKDGLERLSESLPLVAGQVVYEDAAGFKVKPLSKMPDLIIKDLRQTMPTFNEMVQAEFPFSMLHEDMIAPRRTLPERFSEPANVFLVQANFVTGGLLLVFNGQHNCMDMAGQCQVIHLFAKACRGEAFTGEELRIGNLSRRNIIPLLSDDEIGPGPPPKPQPAASISTSVASAPSPKTIWAYFIFSAVSLSALKALAVNTITTDFISTDDVISAFLWQSITRARLARLINVSRTTSNFERQVNVRTHLRLPPTYTGNAVYKASTTLPIEKVVKEPLGVIASQLRSSIASRRDIVDEVRAEATASSRKMKDKPVVSTARPTPPSTDVKMSSWAKEKCYEYDFGGPLGKATAVRRPNFEAWEGLAYLMPKRSDGEIVAAVCLSDEDLDRLKGNAEFVKYGRYVG